MWRSRPTSSLVSKAQTAAGALRHSGRALFLFFATLLIVSSVALLYLLNASLLVSTPARGGSWNEGIVGAPRFINPVLAISDADQDLTTLVYSGLLRATNTGSYVPDVAEKYEISPDGKTYIFTLRDDVVFQDGTPLTVDDVIFTINKIQDPSIKSPERGNWNGVTVQKMDDRTVAFTLRSAYAPFIENFTTGILPKHLWQQVTTEDFSINPLNTAPVGSGPFSVTSVSRSSTGVPTKLELSAFAQASRGEPYLTRMTFTFYQNEDKLIDALRRGDIEAASGITPARLSELPKNLHIEQAPLNRVFAVFLNQYQHDALRDTVVRKALNDAIDREALIRAVLKGYGTALHGPLPESILAEDNTPRASLEEIKATLKAAGWEPGQNGMLQKTSGSGKNSKVVTLSFTLATGNVPELRAAAEYLRMRWGELGVGVDTAVYDQGDLTQTVIRPRKYDALLFGMVVGRTPDLYAFWHSSERTDPGLNIAQYTNLAVDTLVEQLRSTQSDNLRTMLYKQFAAEMSRDIPAVFLYAPDFVYIVPNGIRGLDLGFIETPSDRFLQAHEWHRQTDMVWPIFVPGQS